MAGWRWRWGGGGGGRGREEGGWGVRFWMSMCGKSSCTCKILPAKFRGRNNNNWHNSWRLTGAAQEILPKGRLTLLTLTNRALSEIPTQAKTFQGSTLYTPSDSLCSVVGLLHVQPCVIAYAFRTGRPTDFRFMSIITPLQRSSSEGGEVGGRGCLL